MQVNVRHHRPGDVRAARGTLRGADGPPDNWRLTVGGRVHEPASFESRGDCVWVVFRPLAYNAALAGRHVVVGEMALLATESAAVLRCGAPTDVGTAASISWGQGPDIFPLALGPEPEPPIGAAREVECQLVPTERSRRASTAPPAVGGDDSDPAYTDTSDDDGTASDASDEPEDDTFENPLDVEEEEQSDADSDEEFVDPQDEEDDQEDPDFAHPASASDDDL